MILMYPLWWYITITSSMNCVGIPTNSSAFSLIFAVGNEARGSLKNRNDFSTNSSPFLGLKIGFCDFFSKKISMSLSSNFRFVVEVK